MRQSNCGRRDAEALAVTLTFGLILASPLAAQEYPSPGSQPASRTCTVFAGAPVDGLQQIHANCWGTGVSLGYADRFRAFDNPELRSTVVELEHNGKRHVLLLRPYVGGLPLVEDISGTLAIAAGRVSWAGVEGLAVDFEEFGTAGRIGIALELLGSEHKGQEPARSAVQSSSEPIELSIGQYIALDEARLATAQSTVAEAQ